MTKGMICLAGVSLEFAVRYACAAQLLRERSISSDEAMAPQFRPSSGQSPVTIPDEDWKDFLADGFSDDPYMEYSLITEYFSDALLAYDRVVIHGVALSWHGSAYLICAAPGVGKSTQAHFLQTLRPGEFGIICGDRPILEFRHSERNEVNSKDSPFTIIVHPSPWNGKENWHGSKAAPLSGLILLERGENNRLDLLTEREAAVSMYYNIIHSGWVTENIQRVADMETRLLRAVPIWKLTTHEVPDSTYLLLESVFNETEAGVP